MERPAREMSLAEYVARLPKGHRARRELEELVGPKTATASEPVEWETREFAWIALYHGFHVALHHDGSIFLSNVSGESMTPPKMRAIADACEAKLEEVGREG